MANSGHGGVRESVDRVGKLWVRVQLEMGRIAPGNAKASGLLPW
jgi:hypothetical protein